MDSAKSQNVVHGKHEDDGGNAAFKEDDRDKEGSVSIIFGMKEEVGALARALRMFQNHKVNLIHIESRPSKHPEGNYEFLVECDNKTGGVREAIAELQPLTYRMQILSRSNDLEDMKEAVPWFPRKIKDLINMIRTNQSQSYSSELEPDHPGLNDPVYCARRKEFAEIAFNYQHGQSIPRVNYTEDEIKTWGTIFRKLTTLHPTHACKEYNKVFPLLVENCGYREDNIPQLADISAFLKDCTGFTLRPVAGLLSSRDFLAGLAFRVYHASQFIRHGSRPMYTSEPDCVHEIMGHVPMFADPTFAQFSQEIGLASLGAPDDYLEKLATCYWFTVEFGLCREQGQLKAYGAGLMSSFGELQNYRSGKSEVREFEPSKAGEQEYPLNSFQPVYYVAPSLQDAMEKMISFAANIPRKFGVRYNAYTQMVEVLDSDTKLSLLAGNIKADMARLEDAMKKYAQSHRTPHFAAGPYGG